jgi:hypothetical protein
MITKQFIKYLNDTISEEGLMLMTEFFITFSRFECALKASSYVNSKNDKVTANWDRFLNSIQLVFDQGISEELNVAVEYLINNPPRIQTLNSGNVTWTDRVLQRNQPKINKLGQSIRDIRNNLFHGGKFNGIYQEDISRNYLLLKYSIIVLNDWLSHNNTVKQNFLAHIS